MKHGFATVAVCLLATALPPTASAQQGNVVLAGTNGSASARTMVRGYVTDDQGRALKGVTLIIDQRHMAQSDANGQFTIADLPPGQYVVQTRFIGFASDSIRVMAGGGAPLELRLKPSVADLAPVRVEAQRLQGQALSLNRQRTADQIISVNTSEEIMALPNANAADAFSRLPGVSLQRHEGEGSAVQVRGIDANLNNVTLNGAHMSGKSEDSPGGDRRVYLDGLPAGLVGAVQLNKTLTPDMDADAVGASLAIESLSADAAPGARLNYSYGKSDLQNVPLWLGSGSYGKRWDASKALFVGYTIDHNSRVYDDNEPSYSRIKLANGDSTTIPVGTSAREYWTDRLRQGGTARFDWSPTDNTRLALTGLIANFHDYAIRYRQDHTLSAASVTPTDSLNGTATAGMAATSNVQRRSPTDRTRMFGVKGVTDFGANALDYNLTYSYDQYRRDNARDLTFQQKGLGGSYTWNDALYPTINPANTYSDPTKFAFKSLKVSNPEDGNGTDYGANVNYTIPLETGSWASAIKFGGKFRYENRSYNANILNYLVAPGQTFTLANVLGTFTNANHYGGHYPIMFSPDEGLSESYVANNPVLVVDSTTVIAAALASYTGHEQISAAYASYDVDIDRAHFIIGLRDEATTTSYNSAGTVQTAGKVTGTQPISGGRSYNNLFPNAQMRYALDDATNLRVALTTSMGRPLYTDLAPSVAMKAGALPTDPNALSAGNPNLKPMTSVNEDVMLEHFLPSVGLVSAGFFAKQISNYIYSENFTYVGAPYDGYNGTRPTNAKTGSIEGLEGAWQQRFTFLPGALNGLGLDANGVWTHSTTSTPTRSSMPLPRQAEWNYNIAGTYVAGDLITARVTTQYNGPYIYKVGDGSASPSTGDTYMMPHTQLDASLGLSLNRNAQLVLQGLNLTDAPFGYYIASPHNYIQREVYGRSATVSMRYRLQ